jgi:hypothetical protein
MLRSLSILCVAAAAMLGVALAVWATGTGLSSARGATQSATAGGASHAATLAAGRGAGGQSQGGGSAQIIVGANVQASLEGSDVAHVEQTIAASPTDANFLAAAVTTFVPGEVRQDHVYVSTDRGATWRATKFAEMAATGSVDPGIVITPTGTILFQTGYVWMTNAVFRSTDKGRTWERLKDGSPAFRVAVDRSAGKFRGRIYRGLSYMEGVGVPVEVSTDDGRTFRKGGRACQGTSMGLATMADSTVVAICETENYLVATSSDGGETFGAEHAVAKYEWMRWDEEIKKLPTAWVLPPVQALGLPCAANVYGTAYSDRLYCIWEHQDKEHLTSRLYFGYSADKGATWVKKEVDPAMPQWATEVLPVIAVNQDGAIGIAWSDTRESEKRDRYDVFFTASRDGGETFLPPVRVSSASSFPIAEGNLRATLFAPHPLPDPKIPDTVGDESQFAVSAYNYGRQMGGDYAGLAVDAEGEFHPVWPDARNGTYQLFTTRILVLRAGQNVSRLLLAKGEGTHVSLKDKVTVKLEASDIDVSKSEVTIWARIKNMSAETLYGPFTVDVERMTPGMTLVNASNGKLQEGAQMEYLGAVGTIDVLPPYGVTEALPWRFHMASLRDDDIRFETSVSGFVRKSGEK